jgi:hypothetical protein
MKIIIVIICVCMLGAGGFYFKDRIPEIKSFKLDKITTRDCRAFKMRITAQEIMEKNKKQLLKTESFHYLEPQVVLYPYLLMDVKYTMDEKTGEGVLLWGLNDGEMVIDADKWEKTHGFEDCIVAKADQNDFKIIKALVESGGSLDKDKIYDKFKVEDELLNEWLESAREKKLIVSSGAKLRLHLQNPQLVIYPITRLAESLVSVSTKLSLKAKTRYSSSQIKNLTSQAFGSDFVIRRSEQVYLPILSIGVENPDGSILTTYWNGLNGKRIDENLRDVSIN